MKFPLHKEELGRYQKRLCMLIVLASVPNAFPALQPLVTQYTPDHHCDVMQIFNITSVEQASEVNLDISGNWQEELLNLTIPWSDSPGGDVRRNQCFMYNMTREDLTNRNTSINRTYETIPCTQFYFEGEAISSVTEYGMVCDKAWQKPLITSIYMLGLLVSGICCGVISDTFGRRITFLIFTFLQFIIMVVSSLPINLIAFAVMTFFLGIVTLANFVCAMLIGTEFMPPRYSALGYFSTEMGFAVGSVMFPLVAYFLRDWRWFLRIVGIFGVVYIPYWWLIDETPLWLWASGREKKAEDVLQKVAKYNGKPTQTTEDLQEVLHKDEKNAPAGFCIVVKELATSCTMMLRCVVTAVSWFMVSMSYFAMKLNMNNLSGDRFLNMLYGGLTEFGATLIFYLAVQTRGRRQSYMGFMSVTAVLMTIAALTVSHNGGLATGLSMVCQLSITVAFNVVYLYTAELFPTKSRHSVLGINMIGSRLGGFISPFIIYAGENGNTLAPSLATAGAIAASVISYLILPETRGKELPSTVKEAKDLPGGLHVRLRCRQDQQMISNSDDESKIEL